MVPHDRRCRTWSSSHPQRSSMPHLARLIIPSILFASAALLPACASSTGEKVDSSGDNLTTWEPATTGLPKWATTDRLREFLNDNENVTVQVHLKLRNEGEAEAELNAISDPE